MLLFKLDTAPKCVSSPSSIAMPSLRFTTGRQSVAALYLDISAVKSLNSIGANNIVVGSLSGNLFQTQSVTGNTLGLNSVSANNLSMEARNFDDMFLLGGM